MSDVVGEASPLNRLVETGLKAGFLLAVLAGTAALAGAEILTMGGDQIVEVGIDPFGD